MPVQRNTADRRAWLQNQIAMVEAQSSTPGTGDMERQGRVLKDLQMQLARLDDADGITSPADLVEIVKGELNWTGLDMYIEHGVIKITIKTAAMERLEKTFREVIFAQRADAMMEAKRSSQRRTTRPATQIGVARPPSSHVPGSSLGGC